MLLGNPLRLAARIDAQHVFGGIPKRGLAATPDERWTPPGHQIALSDFLFAVTLFGCVIPKGLSSALSSMMKGIFVFQAKGRQATGWIGSAALRW